MGPLPATADVSDLFCLKLAKFSWNPVTFNGQVYSNEQIYIEDVAIFNGFYVMKKKYYSYKILLIALSQITLFYHYTLVT